MSNRSELRKNLMIALYQYLLLGKGYLSLKEILKNHSKLKSSEFVQVIVYGIMRHESDFITKIDQQLQDWTFDRLGKIEQAILLMAYSEICADINEKAVVINEAVNLAKEFCEEDSYKIINATLDKL